MTALHTFQPQRVTGSKRQGVDLQGLGFKLSSCAISEF